jgi:ABC-type lipoprotein release transport system permease subunit
MYQGMLSSRLRTVIDREVAHLQIHHPQFKDDYEARFTIQAGDSQLSKLKRMSEIKALVRRSVTSGMLTTSTGSSGVQVLGVEPEQENIVSQLKSKLIEGDGFVSSKRNQVLIGKKLADKMQLKLGHKLVLTFTDKENTIVSAAFRVAGIYQTDNTPLDERQVFVAFTDLNRLLGIDNDFHELAILLNSDQALDSLKVKLQQLLPGNLVETWREISPETQLMIETTNQYSFIFIVIIMLALAFGIINTMLMAILERSREIGMLVALGMNRVKLFFLVLWETVMLTMAGVPFGFGSAWFIVQYYNNVGIDISSFSGEAMSGFGFSSLIRPEFPWSQLVIVVYIVISTALFASIFPSIKALRLQPVEAMRL